MRNVYVQMIRNDRESGQMQGTIVNSPRPLCSKNSEYEVDVKDLHSIILELTTFIIFTASLSDQS